MMEKEKLITVSVRLCEAEYRALQSAAREEYTTMSGMLRKLLRDAVEGRKNDGTQNGFAETPAKSNEYLRLFDGF